MMAMLCALSIVLVWLDRNAPLAVWAGMMSATIVILFTMGPGNIFPVVMVFAGGMSALAILPGWLVGMLATATRSGARQRHRG
jgi:hypothetical protein